MIVAHHAGDPPCAHCGGKTRAMYSVGKLADASDRWPLCRGCFFAGVTREQSERQRAIATALRRGKTL